MKYRFLVLLVVAAGACVVAESACDNPPLPTVCQDLAAPACPTDFDADVCSDVECGSVYACDNGTWTFVQTCPNYSPEAGVHPFEAGPEASGGVDAAFDAPPGAFGGPGCTDLEEPDCPLGTALACDHTFDCCECMDLYVCDDGGWELWGECTDAGVTPNGH